MTCPDCRFSLTAAKGQVTAAGKRPIRVGYQAAACSCLNWAVAGAGPAVVAIHAGSAHPRMCDSLVPALAQVLRRIRPGYQLNVKTAGYPAGTYTLSFTADSDPTTHTAQFVVS